MHFTIVILLLLFTLFDLQAEVDSFLFKYFEVGLVKLERKSSLTMSAFTDEQSSVLIELPLPYQSAGLIQRIRNDIILNKAIDGKIIDFFSFSDLSLFCVIGKSRNYIFKILTPDTATPTACIFAYISELYSKSWNEAVLRNQFDANIIVTSDLLTDNHLSARYQFSKIYSAGPIPASSKEELGVSSFPEIIDYSAILSSFEASVQRWKVVVLDDYPAAIENPHPHYDYVAVGGSFDQLHNGHKKLLYSCLAVCDIELTVGITADAMLAGKTFAENIQQFPQRFQNVHDYLTLFRSGLKLNIVEINDPFGPTITDVRLQAIVASSETITGAFKINEIRETKGWPPLDILIIGRSDSAILSSTFLRKQRMIQQQTEKR